VAPAGSYPLALWQLADGTRAFCHEGTVITAGAAVEWLVDLGVAGDAAEVDRLARDATQADDAFFVPALEGLGTPWLEDGATGVIGGLTRGSGRAELARALLEGIAQRCVDVCEALALGDSLLRVDGGLAQSEWLLQALADRAGRPLARAAEVETTALGAAHLAGLATGVFADPAACRAVLAAPTRFEPRWDASRRQASRARWSRALRMCLQSERPGDPVA
jgi:glycerol kinase